MTPNIWTYISPIVVNDTKHKSDFVSQGRGEKSEFSSGQGQSRRSIKGLKQHKVYNYDSGNYAVSSGDSKQRKVCDKAFLPSQ